MRSCLIVVLSSPTQLKSENFRKKELSLVLPVFSLAKTKKELSDFFLEMTFLATDPRFTRHLEGAHPKKFVINGEEK